MIAVPSVRDLPAVVQVSVDCAPNDSIAVTLLALQSMALLWAARVGVR